MDKMRLLMVLQRLLSYHAVLMFDIAICRKETPLKEI